MSIFCNRHIIKYIRLFRIVLNYSQYLFENRISGFRQEPYVRVDLANILIK